MKVGTPQVTVLTVDVNGHPLLVTGTTVPTDGDAGFAVGCKFIKTDGSAGTVEYVNEGTVSSADFNAVLAGSITAARARGSEQAVTATADGLTTGLITTPTALITPVSITSAAATNAVSLPAASAALVGSIFYLTVGANGYELLTSASSNNTINLVDSDGTNQLDVAANTTVRVTCVSATGFLAETIAATSIAVTAPDND